MKFSSLCVLLALELYSCVHARFLTEVESKDGTLHLGLMGRRPSSFPHGNNHLVERAGETTESQLKSIEDYYSIEVELGTPGQRFVLAIDTGSSDMWVPDATNPHCATTKKHPTKQSQTCEEFGMFDRKKSSTFSSNNSEFQIQYGDGAEAKGIWATDTLSIQNHTIKNMFFGLNTVSNETSGMLGIGYDTNESTNNAYPNLPLRLAQDNITNTPAYSLWLNDPDSGEGNLLFGGVDHAKYSGNLTKVPVLRKGVKPPQHLLVAIQSVKMDFNGKTTEMLDDAYGALLDSGTTNMVFPEPIAQSIYQRLNASHEPTEGAYVTRCNINGSLEFNFSGATILVKFNQILRPLYRDDRQVFFDNGEPACTIGIEHMKGSSVILGDTFLQAAYVVYDLQNHEVALAQCVFNATESDIEVITNTIPSATQASAYSSTSVQPDDDIENTESPNFTMSQFPNITLTRTGTITGSMTTKVKSSPSHTSGTVAATSTKLSSSTASVILVPSNKLVLIGALVMSLAITLF